MQCLLSVGIRSYFTQCDVCKKMLQCTSVEEYFSVEVTHYSCINLLINNTPLKSFSVDFILF